MRKLKLMLLAGLFGTGAAFAGQDMVEQKPEQVPADQAAYDSVIPSQSSETPG